MELKGELGKYKILKKIGSGGFGTVYLAEDKILKAKRALKIPHRSLNSLKEPDRIFLESINHSQLLDHKNIVKLLTADIIGDYFVMVMEYVVGEDLETIMDRKRSLPLNKALSYIEQILSALEFAHSFNIIHRDIRPSNIMIDKNDNVKITDFGTSATVANKPYATTKIGSPPYMAPEQFEGKAVKGSDVYSAACLLYEMLSGFPPIVLANPMEIYNQARSGKIPSLKEKAPVVSRELEAVILKALKPDCKERYASAAQFSEEIKIALGRPNSKSFNEKDNQYLEIKEKIDRGNKKINIPLRTCWQCRRTIPIGLEYCPFCKNEQY